MNSGLSAAVLAARTAGGGSSGGGAPPRRGPACLQRAPAHGGLVGRLARQIPGRSTEHRLRATTQAGKRDLTFSTNSPTDAKNSPWRYSYVRYYYDRMTIDISMFDCLSVCLSCHIAAALVLDVRMKADRSALDYNRLMQLMIVAWSNV